MREAQNAGHLENEQPINRFEQIPVLRDLRCFHGAAALQAHINHKNVAYATTFVNGVCSRCKVCVPLTQLELFHRKTQMHARSHVQHVAASMHVPGQPQDML